MMDELAKRADAADGWRWMPGMLVLYGFERNVEVRGLRVIEVNGGVPYGLYWGHWSYAIDAKPDLSDPATLGCLLALVREKHGELCYVYRMSTGWCVYSPAADEGWLGATEAEALVAALEASH